MDYIWELATSDWSDILTSKRCFDHYSSSYCSPSTPPFDRRRQHRRSSLNLYAMSSHRSHFRNVRNVRFFDEANPDVVLGGLIQNGSLTENFLVKLDIVLAATALIRVSAKDTGRVVSIVNTRLDAGDYSQLWRWNPSQWRTVSPSHHLAQCVWPGRCLLKRNPCSRWQMCYFRCCE